MSKKKLNVNLGFNEILKKIDKYKAPNKMLDKENKKDNSKENKVISKSKKIKN